MKAMLFAAGLGTRLRPLTNEIPKALVPVNGVPLIDLVISKLQRSGVTELVVNVHYFAEKLIAHLSSREWGMKIHISHEKDLLLETGGGLLFAKEHLINQPSFLVLNVDILTDLNMVTLFENHKTNNALATLAVQKRNSSRLLLFNENHALCGWQNTKTDEYRWARQTTHYESFAFSGISVMSHRIFDYMAFDSPVFSLVDVWLRAAEKEPVGFLDHTGGTWIDVGTPDSLQKAEMIWNVS